MKHLLAGLFAASLALPVAAQEPAIVASDDLDCAIFVALAMESAELSDDPGASLSFAAGLTYFIGRYEGQGGTNLKQDLRKRLGEISLQSLSQLEAKCTPKLEEMTAGLDAAGEAFDELDPSQEDAADVGEPVDESATE